MTGPGLEQTRAVQEAVEDGGYGWELQHARLPRVLHESPAAVLLVDLVDRCVVQANPAGRDLATVRRIVDEVDRRVPELLGRLSPG